MIVTYPLSVTYMYKSLIHVGNISLHTILYMMSLFVTFHGISNNGSDGCYLMINCSNIYMTLRVHSIRVIFVGLLMLITLYRGEVHTVEVFVIFTRSTVSTLFTQCRSYNWRINITWKLVLL